MKIQSAFHAILPLALALQHASAQTPANPELRDELLRMQEADQAIRSLDLQAPEEIRVLSAVDTLNTARLKQIVAAHGWPSASLVGKDGAGAAWLLAQHADADPEFQRQVLGFIEALVATGEVEGSHHAYLWDRTHDPQKYGTQGRCVARGRWEPREIEDAEGVDARRSKIGLPPMEEYIKHVSELCARDD